MDLRERDNMRQSTRRSVVVVFACPRSAFEMPQMTLPVVDVLSYASHPREDH